MRRLVALTVGGILSVFLAAVVNAVPANTAVNPQQHQGLINAKKATQGKLARDKKVDEIRKKGQRQKERANNKNK